MDLSKFMINVKKGVRFSEINAPFIKLAQIMWDVHLKYDAIPPTITSANDGTHSNHSFHYLGLGWDWRIWNLPSDKLLQIVEEIQMRAKDVSARYDIVLERDHIHTEYDIRKKI